jgi:hypothetical protein
MTSSLLTTRGQDIWTIEEPFSIGPVQVGARMTIVRTNEGLLVISPLAPTPERVEVLASLGEVMDIVAPNTFHFLDADTG